MQGRGASTGYDNAVALPAKADADELQKENQKSVAVLRGTAVFSIAKRAPAASPHTVRAIGPLVPVASATP